MQLLRKFFGFFVLEICSCVKFFWLCIAQLDFGLVALEVCKKLIEKDLRLHTISLPVNSVSLINIYHSLANAVNFILDLDDEYLLCLSVACVLWVFFYCSKLPQAHPTLGNHVSQTNGDSVSFTLCIVSILNWTLLFKPNLLDVLRSDYVEYLIAHLLIQTACLKHPR
jgi:hypothetical protein